MEGPSWLGIGAQRSGTTWFTDLVRRHPGVALARDGRKELHYFDRFLTDAWDDAAAAAYDAMFDPAKAAGDFTPSYLRCLWVPALARRVCRPDIVLVALLRDPIERFNSAMRWYAGRPNVPAPDRTNDYRNWVRNKGNDAVWGGMYATQLAAWRSEFPAARFLVMQYEAAVRAPQEAASRVWRALGLEPRELGSNTERTWNSTQTSQAQPWSSVPGLREHLVTTYEREVLTLESEWGIDRALWPSFA